MKKIITGEIYVDHLIERAADELTSMLEKMGYSNGPDGSSYLINKNVSVIIEVVRDEK